MLALDFTNTGYIYMALIWMLAPTIGVYLAIKKKRNPFFWGVICLLIPMALFAIGGMRAPGEELPPMFRNEQQPDTDSDSAQDTTHSTSSVPEPTSESSKETGSINGNPIPRQ